MEKDFRPWGHYDVLADEKDHKVKRIVVQPGKRLSLQRHRQRAEHWYIVQGRGVVTLDNLELPLSAGQAVDIPKKYGASDPECRFRGPRLHRGSDRGLFR